MKPCSLWGTERDAESGSFAVMPARAAARATVIECSVIFVLFALMAFALRAWVFELRVIPSASMRPALEIGDRLLVEKLTPRWRGLRRGAVVVFVPPVTGVTPRGALVKRVVGLPGERISFRDRRVWIEGRPLAEPYLTAGTQTMPWPGQREKPTVRLIPAGSIFVLGDNRQDSTDSRHFGFVALREVIGCAILGVWPLERWRWLSPLRN